MKNLSIILLCILLFGCSSGGRQQAADTLSTHDSVVSVDKTLTVTQADPGPSPADILKSCLQNYKTITTIDTTLVTDSGTLHVHLKHYCTYDDGIILPEKYTRLLMLKSLATHNFVTDVLISKNMTPVYAGRITRDDFLPLLTGDLKQYGSLLYIDRRLQVSRTGKGFVINYSLSIPLTDVGRQVTIAIEPDGSKQAFINYGSKTEKAYTMKLIADTTDTAPKNP
jgi:hypothetical protein